MKQHYLNVAIGALLLSTAACQDKPKPASPPATVEPPTDTAQAPKKQPTTTEAAETAQKKNTPQAAKAALDKYEKIRELLANDKAESLADTAEELASSTKAAAAKAEGQLKSELQSIATAASELKKEAGKGLDEARLAFGELSKHMVSLVSHHPGLQKGRHVFECPMAKGYKKWVQADEKMANPYMGQKMLECGSPSEWSK